VSTRASRYIEATQAIVETPKKKNEPQPARGLTPAASTGESLPKPEAVKPPQSKIKNQKPKMLSRPPSTRILALMNQKGGVGKTTTAVNVGAALANLGLRVLCIDLDPQAHLTLSLGIEPDQIEKSNYELLTDPDTTAMEVVRYTARDDRNLAVLPAETNLAGVESELSDLVRTGLAQTILRNKCRDLIKEFDYVLIDCPPSLGLLTINALTMASQIVVPMQAHFLALQGMTKLFETIGMVRQGINPNLTVAGVVLCMHEGNTLLATEVINELEGFFEKARGTELPWADGRVFTPPIRRNIKLAEAPSFGQSVHAYAPDSNGAKDYVELARSIAGQG
jgi:chromosome partitioning protein